MIANKNIKIFFNYFIGSILFLWLSYSIFQQIKNKSNFLESWIFIQQAINSTTIFYLFLVIVLMGLNWSLEALKWKISVRQVQTVSFSTACKAVFTGVSFSIIMPNRTGEYLGRVLYMEEGKRLRMVALTVLGSICQLIVTLLFGVLSIAAFSSVFFQRGATAQFSSIGIFLLVAGGLLLILVLTLFYFRLQYVAKWLLRWNFLKKHAAVIQELEMASNSLLLKLFYISTLRYFVFMLQYYLLFIFFGVDIIWWQATAATAAMFFVMAITPTIALFEIVQKIFVANAIFYLFTNNLLGVGFVITTIWVVNLILPAIVGSLLIVRLKLFRTKYE